MGELLDTKVYSSIGSGVSAETDYGYSVMGLENYVKDPTNTITRTIYDVRGLTVSTWVGTADAGATDSDPTGGRVGMPSVYSTNNMLPVESYAFSSIPGIFAGRRASYRASYCVILCA